MRRRLSRASGSRGELAGRPRCWSGGLVHGGRESELAVRYLRSTPLELEVKKRAPEAAGAMRKISEDARTDRGWALARLGDGGWWPAVERGLRHGTFEDDVIAGLAERDPWLSSARLGD